MLSHNSLHRSFTLLLAVLLGAAAALDLAFVAGRAFDADDVAPLETPLLLSVAGQRERGFGSLYGPYSGANPMVLIHAPLYYRLAGVASWPLTAVGVRVVSASLIAGRAISAVATVALLLVAAWLATVGGVSRHAGFFAAALIAATPVLGTLAVMVRPDVLATALQSVGIGLVVVSLRVGEFSVEDFRKSMPGWIEAHLRGPDAREPDRGVEEETRERRTKGPDRLKAELQRGERLNAEFQRGDSPKAELQRGDSPKAEVQRKADRQGRQDAAPATRIESGRGLEMAGCAPKHRSVVAAYVAFALAACTKQHNVVAALVSSVLLLGACITGRIRLRSIALAHAAGLGVAAAVLLLEDVVTNGRMSWSVFALPAGPLRTINYGDWSHVATVAVMTIKKAAGLLAVATACALGLVRFARVKPLDAILALYLIAELVALVPLCFFNRGAADNYALQAVVLSGVLLGRAIARTLDRTPVRVFGAVTLALAALVVLEREWRWVASNVGGRRVERTEMRALRDDPRALGSVRARAYFAHQTRYNRLFGDPALAHDEWLYSAFEVIGEAQPRETWLGEILMRGPIDRVIAPDEKDGVPGLAKSLPEMGFRPVVQHGRYCVWQRTGVARARRQR